MKILYNLKKILKNPYIVFSYLGSRNRLKCVPDRKYLKLLFKAKLKEDANFDAPETFNQKLQWLKLYDRNINYVKMVDKYNARKYVKKVIGAEYLIPILGVYSEFNEINFNELPNKFVLKTTHDSGGVVICKSKNSFDYKKAKKKLNKSLETNYFYKFREWPYKNVEPKIICESYMNDGINNELVDYKFYCFNGNPTYCQIIKNRNAAQTIDFFDMKWNHQPFVGMQKLPNTKDRLIKPDRFEEMIELAEKLSKNIPFVRVDFYYINNKIYFGELTFFPRSGFGEFEPEEWNLKFGQMLKLPKK